MKRKDAWAYRRSIEQAAANWSAYAQYMEEEPLVSE